MSRLKSINSNYCLHYCRINKIVDHMNTPSHEKASIFYFEENRNGKALKVWEPEFFKANSEELATHVIRRIVAPVFSEALLALTAEDEASFIRPFFTSNFLVEATQVSLDIVHCTKKGISVKLASIRLSFDYIYSGQPNSPHILVSVSDINYNHLDQVNIAVKQLLHSLSSIVFSPYSFFKGSKQGLYASELKNTFLKLTTAWEAAWYAIEQYVENELCLYAPDAFVLSSDYGERPCTQWQRPHNKEQCFCLLSRQFDDQSGYITELSSIELDWSAKKAGKPTAAKGKFILKTSTEASLAEGVSLLTRHLLSSVYNP